MTQFFNRKDKCSLMWRMVGCGFLPASKTDPWNVCGNQPGEHWLDHIGKRISSATAIIVESVTDFLPIYTAAQRTAIFMAQTNCTSTFVLFVPRLNLKKVLFLKTCAFVLSYSIMNCDLCQLWFCHFVSEAMQTWTLHIYLVIILQISHIYHCTSCTPALIIQAG